MPLPITPEQHLALRKLRRSHPPIGNLAIDLASAFDETCVDNPELARVILETLCRRLIQGKPVAVDSLVSHFQTLGQLGCLNADSVASFTKRVKELPTEMPQAHLPKSDLKSSERLPKRQKPQP